MRSTSPSPSNCFLSSGVSLGTTLYSSGRGLRVDAAGVEFDLRSVLNRLDTAFVVLPRTCKVGVTFIELASQVMATGDKFREPGASLTVGFKEIVKIERSLQLVDLIVLSLFKQRDAFLPAGMECIKCFVVCRLDSLILNLSLEKAAVFTELASLVLENLNNRLEGVRDEGGEHPVPIAVVVVVVCHTV